MMNHCFRLLVLTLFILQTAACLAAEPGGDGGAQKTLNASFGLAAGLEQLSCDGVNLLQNGVFKVLKVTLKTPDGVASEGEIKSSATHMDNVARKLSMTFPWGVVSCHYEIKGNRLEMAIKVTNQTQNQIISAISLQPLVLEFGHALKDYPDWPLMKTTIDEPTTLLLHDQALGIAVCNDDVIRPLAVSFGKVSDEPVACAVTIKTNQDPFLHYVNPQTKQDEVTKDWPVIDRPIYPQMTDCYDISIRVGGPNATTPDLAEDVLAKFRQAFPYRVKWEDRRPIGYLMLSSSHQKVEENVPDNPRGWVCCVNQKKLNINTAEGLAELKAGLMKYADIAVKVLKDANAQGAITWDCEGQEWPHATSYLGDPRSLPPEIEPLLDEYFKHFTDAGLRTGICIRPTLPMRPAYGTRVHHYDLLDPVKNMIEKAAYARKRWGCTLFYVDSNVDPIFWRTSEASLFRKLLEAHPDCLFIPEHKLPAHYAYGPPLHVIEHSTVRTPANILEIYPEAFGVVSIVDPLPKGKPMEYFWKDVVAGVKHGDIILFRAWFDDSYNLKMKQAYVEAGKSK